MAGGVLIQIGPIDAAVATEWIANRRLLVEAVRTSGVRSVNQDAVDLLEVILGLMATEAARGEVFEWQHELDADVLILVARYWLDLGTITADQRLAMGVPAPAPDTDAMTDAVVRGMVAALRAAGPKALPLLDRLT